MWDYGGYGNYEYDGAEDAAESYIRMRKQKEEEDRIRHQLERLQYEMMLIGRVKSSKSDSQVSEQQKYDQMLSRQR